MKFSLLAAAAMPQLAATEACGAIDVEQFGAEAPERCIADPGCAWQMLDGLCVESTDARVAAIPNCCIGDPCESKSVDDAKDSVCRLSTTTNSKVVTSAPPLDEIYHSLHLAGAAYCAKENVESWSCGLHCDGAPTVSIHRYIETTDFLTGIFVGYVGYDSSLDAIVIAVRGTDNSQGIKNWVANLDFVKTKPYSQYPEAGVHEGFYKVWARMKDEVLAGIEELAAELGGPKTIHFVGHSMGGAVATDGALDLVLNHGLTVGVHTFGSPRAGDYPYAVAIDEQLAYHFRFTHNDDLVAHVPPQALGFYHPAWEVHFPEPSGLEYKLCDGSGEDNHCANACAFFLTCTNVNDHLNYLDIPATCGAQSLTTYNSTIVV